MWPTDPRLLVAGALLLGGAPAGAQVTVVPESLRVVVPQGGEVTAAVTLTNSDPAAFPFCLDFDRPLQRRAGIACEPPGQLIARNRGRDIGQPFWGPYALTMTPEGRLLVAEWGTYFDGVHYGLTYEFEADFELVRVLRHPVLADFAPNPVTVGVTYNEHSGTIWWTNYEELGSQGRRVHLLEGTRTGEATGRRIELPVFPTGPPPTNSGIPIGASYDPASGFYYFLDTANEMLWAVDSTGTVPVGYPRELTGYPGWNLGRGVDAHGGVDGGRAGVRLDVALGPPGLGYFDRVVVTDPLGANLGSVTPVPSFGLEQETMEGVPVRSRIDPNGVLYLAYIGWDPQVQAYETGVAAVRPAPLPPSWLTLSDWAGELPAGGSEAISLTFHAGGRAPGEYHSTLVVEDSSGVVLASVPLTLVVEADTPAEPPPAEAGLSLLVTPNPARSVAAVTFSLARASPARVAIHDLLGREVAVLHAGPLAAGARRLEWDAGGLAPGLYVVHAVGDGHTASVRVAVAGR